MMLTRLRMALAGRAKPSVLTLALSIVAATAAHAEPASASLSGVIRAGADHAPLAGARVYAGNPQSGAVYPSEPTPADGTFAIRDLPAATYRLAVEASAGLFPVEQPVTLAPGINQALGISLAPSTEADPAPGEDDTNSEAAPAKGKRPNLWNNPLTAALLVLGVAVVFGLIIESATDDDDTELPASPLDTTS